MEGFSKENSGDLTCGEEFGRRETTALEEFGFKSPGSEGDVETTEKDAVEQEKQTAVVPVLLPLLLTHVVR